MLDKWCLLVLVLTALLRGWFTCCRIPFPRTWGEGGSIWAEISLSPLPLSLRVSSPLVSRPQISLWLGSSQSKASGKDVPRDGPPGPVAIRVEMALHLTLSSHVHTLAKVHLSEGLNPELLLDCPISMET